VGREDLFRVRRPEQGGNLGIGTERCCSCAGSRRPKVYLEIRATSSCSEQGRLPRAPGQRLPVSMKYHSVDEFWLTLTAAR
jgi:mannose-6-phosphate isomerase-like protein (cupin superfamily)